MADRPTRMPRPVELQEMPVQKRKTKAGEEYARRMGQRVLRVLLDPALDTKTEEERAKAAGMTVHTWYRWKTADLVAFSIKYRRALLAKYLPAVDQALAEAAVAGSHPHMLTFYERTEGWIPRRDRKDAGDRPPEGIDADVWDHLGVDARRDITDRLGQARRLARDPARRALANSSTSAEPEPQTPST